MVFCNMSVRRHFIELTHARSRFYQFKVYPALGPPNGRLTHLAMLRLGLW
jgi:hypothetical protein